MVHSLGRFCCLQTDYCRQIPDLEIVVVLEGVGHPSFKVIASHHKFVVARQTTTGTLARLAALWTSYERPFSVFDESEDVILRTGECLPCCIRQGLRNPERVTFIIP